MTELSEDRLTIIETRARETKALWARVQLELVGEVRRLRERIASIEDERPTGLSWSFAPRPTGALLARTPWQVIDPGRWFSHEPRRGLSPVSATPPIDLQLLADLTTKYRDRLPDETIEEVVRDTWSSLSTPARFEMHLPVLVRRIAEERLRDQLRDRLLHP